MESIIAIKSNMNQTNPRLGYLSALLCNENGNWSLATNENVPKHSEIFVHGDYENDVENKFREGMFIQAPVELVDDSEQSRCEFATYSNVLSYPDKKLNLATVFEVDGLMDIEREIQLRSPIKPMGAIFISVLNEKDVREIVGPYETSSTQFDKIQNNWQISLQPASLITLKSLNIDPYTMFRADIDTIPNGHLFFFKQHETSEGCVGIGIDLIKNLKTIQAPTFEFINTKILLSKVNDALSVNSRFGRKGKREFLDEIKALQSLKPTIQNDAFELFKDSYETREKVIKILKNVIEIDETLIQSHTPKDEKQIEELKVENESLKEKAREANVAYKLLVAQQDDIYEKNKSNTSKEEESEITDLKEQVRMLKKIENLDLNHTELEVRIKILGENKLKIENQVEALKQTSNQLRADVMKDNRKFRDKALEVLPFLDVLNTSLDEEPEKFNQYQLQDTDFFDCKDNDIIDCIVDRVIHQGYIADVNFLNFAVAACLSSRFVGFFGEPGTGKTTLARCITNAFSIDAGSNAFINVGKGWNSHTDFIGYDNTFIDKFKYQNQFFSQFEEGQQTGINHPIRTVILDEASLSAIDSYLSDFMSINVPYQEQQDYLVNLSGKKFNIPLDFRFLLTFNFDENTEVIPKKFIDRMPIIHCFENDNGSEARLDFNAKHQPISPFDIQSLLSNNFIDNDVKNPALWEVVEDFLDKWTSLPGYIISPRKKMQLKMFFMLVEKDNFDEGYLLDFIGLTYLLPLVDGSGEKFEDALKKLTDNVLSVNTNVALTKLLDSGNRLQAYRYI